MLTMPRKRSELEIRPRIRVIRDDTILMGPGKADLLEAIERTGSIRKAAEELGMSYMRAWTLVKAMNDGFRDPVIESSRGGSGRGGARLTRTGHAVLELYRQMQESALRAAADSTRKLRKLLK